MAFRLVSSLFHRRAALRVTQLTQRHFSAVSLVNTEAPRLYGTTGKLTEALFEYVQKADEELADDQESVLEAVKYDLRHFVTLSSCDAVNEALFDETNDMDQREEFLTSLNEEAKFDETSAEFFHLLLQEGHIDKVDDIAEDFESLYLYSTGVVSAKVTTADPLTDTQKEMLATKVESMLPEDYSFVLEEELDKSILGGMILKVGENVFDCTAKSTIDSYETAIANPQLNVSA